MFEWAVFFAGFHDAIDIKKAAEAAFFIGQLS
jgi:hypothetical protein